MPPGSVAQRRHPIAKSSLRAIQAGVYQIGRSLSMVWPEVARMFTRVLHRLWMAHRLWDSCVWRLWQPCRPGPRTELQRKAALADRCRPRRPKVFDLEPRSAYPYSERREVPISRTSATTTPRTTLLASEGEPGHFPFAPRSGRFNQHSSDACMGRGANTLAGRSSTPAFVAERKHRHRSCRPSGAGRQGPKGPTTGYGL
jgi:hypothetical protein